jgi:hypothetical protein
MNNEKNFPGGWNLEPEKEKPLLPRIFHELVPNTNRKIFLAVEKTAA